MGFSLHHSRFYMPSDQTPATPHNHGACKGLTALVLEHAPKDGSLGRSRRFHKGTIIWRSHEPADSLYLLLRGQVTIQISDIEGRETTLLRIESGQPFGELCFCSQRRNNIARAMVQCQVLEISYAEFLEFLTHHRAVLHALVYAFCERLNNAEARIGALAHRGAEQRLGALLLELIKAHPHPAADPRQMMVRISHDELARMAAMSRSHVTVTLGGFRRRGLVRYTRGQPLLVNVPALTKYLEQRD